MTPTEEGPLNARARLDLHIHTDRSDGRLSPDALLRRCAEGGLDVVAVTDHDLPPAHPAGRVRIAGRDMHLVHAAEVSGTFRDLELHLLVYFPGEMPEDYRAFLEERARFRAWRYDEVLRRAGLEGVVPPADADARAGRRALTRHHLARALVEAGHVSNVPMAFSTVVGRRSGNVPPVDLAFTDAIRIAREAGAFTAWAHPNLTHARAWATELASAGLQGMECSRPALGRHARAVLSRIAQKNRLLITGGSDWHGWTGGAPGQFAFPMREARPWVRAVGLA